ncbi:MAG: HAD-IIIA family hydrolase [Thermoplasmata archaeon]|jgi:D-sedoheptulose 7-phosphate isomerase|nr:HAD-IIIA family hydrolase [Thermoplasmata archaeon]
MTIESIQAEFNRSAETISKIDPAQVRKAADIILEAFRNGGQVIFMGNGGSSADAQHIAAEFSGKYLIDRPALPSISLSNIAPVTAIGNDYSYDIVFKRQIEANCRKGDVVIGLSTSGNSKNVVLALEKAKEIGAKTISFTGDGGKMRDMVDCAVIIPSKETPRIQEGYLCACHTMCGIVEREMFGNRAVFIDRDDTVAKDVPYCHDPDLFNLYEGVPEAIRRLNEAGFKVIMITNQSGIGRGYFTLDELNAVNSKMCREIEAKGGHLDDIFYCPHTPEDHCSCRKPEIGMGVQAVMKHGINPHRSFMVGDHDKDIEFGKRLGCRSIKVSPEFTFVDAVEMILRMN